MAPGDNGDRCFPIYNGNDNPPLFVQEPSIGHAIRSERGVETQLKYNRAKIRRMRKEINNLSASHERMKAGYTTADRQRKALDMMLDQERQLGRLYQQMAADYKVELDRVRNKLKEMEERYGKR